MAHYITGQRKELVSFLRDNPDKQFSAKQIAQSVNGDSISLSAVYRNLAGLEDAGLISRSVRDGSREIFYQYIDSDECKNCIHLTCTECGSTFHMSHAIMQQLLDAVASVDGFSINKTKTVMYGVCNKCRT